MKRVPDPTLLKGTSEVDEYGAAGARDERQPQGLRRRAARCCTRTPGTRPTAPSRRSSASARSRSPSRSRRPSRRRSTRLDPAATDGVPDAPPASTASALATASPRTGGHARGPSRRRIHRGVRGGALRDELPARSTAYWSRKRAPRRSTQRVQTRSRSSKYACPVIADIGRRHQRLDPLRLDRKIAAGMLRRDRRRAPPPSQTTKDA